MSNLKSFYGKECPHCITMEPLIVQLQKETGVEVDRLEVWHDDANMKILEGYDKGVCGGVPYFYNTETGKSICGEATVDELKAWAGK
jgi:thiol-disulfide isomerase/thioredoxin